MELSDKSSKLLCINIDIMDWNSLLSNSRFMDKVLYKINGNRKIARQKIATHPLSENCPTENYPREYYPQEKSPPKIVP